MMDLRYYVTFREAKKPDMVNMMKNEEKLWKKSQKEMAKITPILISKIEDSLRERFKAKGIEADVETELELYSSGWDLDWCFEDSDKEGMETLVMEWSGHPLLSYKDEKTAAYMYAMMFGKWKHYATQGVRKVLRFLKSIRDPMALLNIDKDDKTVREKMLETHDKSVREMVQKRDPEAEVRYMRL